MADVRLTATNPEDSSVVPVACDAAGRLLLEEPQVIEGPPGPSGEQGPPGDPFSGNFAGDVTFGGSAEFAGYIDVGAPNGNASDAKGVRIDNNGQVVIQREANSSGTLEAISILKGTSASPSATIYNNGNADFAGSVQIEGDPTNAGGNERGIKFQSNAGTSVVIANAVSANLILGKTIGSDVNTIAIKANGSAEFAGGLLEVRSAGTLRKYHEASQVDTHFLDLGTNPTYTYLNSTSNGSGTSQPLHLLTKSAGQTKSFVFGTDGSLTVPGSAEFAGGKAGFTKEGYLWCTTERGDTVYLQGTSQGVGIWAEYTPTTRLEEIRDKLDANRGDTGEMPADTP